MTEVLSSVSVLAMPVLPDDFEAAEGLDYSAGVFCPLYDNILPSFLLISRVGPRDFELDAVECRVLLPGLQQCTLLPRADHVGDVQRASHARGDPSCRVLVCFSTHDGHRNVFNCKTSVLTSPSRTLAFPRKHCF